MPVPPLRENSRTDLFDLPQLPDDLAENSFDYFFTGKRMGDKNTGLIDLYVVTWIIDATENIFIRYCIYSGHRETWKNKIIDQLRNFMRDIGIGNEIINGQLRFFEVIPEKYYKTESFEKKFLEIKAKMKSNI